MKAPDLSRRGFVKRSLAVAAPVLLAATALPVAGAEGNAAKRLKVVCVGGHPDDPESGCAGALARYADAGHRVTIIYLTRGERGIRDKSNEEAAAIRSAECEAACKIIGAKPLFAGQIDGSTEMTRSRLDELHKLVLAEAPDVLFTHWPIDTHFDHQVASLLAIRSGMALPRPPHLFFFEVNSGSQTQGFLPNTYIDITPVVERKKSALFAHVSQDGVDIWRQHHEIVAAFRGREAGVRAAEAFVHLNRDSQTSPLPGV
ncbi:MAG: PIG-L deacetylase family protein [Limisphaerales bacterium]